ncbi:hypothetical protein ACTM97_06255 [Oliverpabstia intestinalis]|uniref:hypothetical protein n=1 Tax=Oliverpabstia intestinalis TaxID=2606633 RepID=UPI003F8B2B23
MRRRTTTAQINAALPMMEVIKAEYYNKDTYTTTAIDTATFTENLQFLAESGKLTDCMGWTYEKNPGSKSEYIIESGRMNQESNAFVIAWMRLYDGVGMDEVEKMLLMKEED